MMKNYLLSILVCILVMLPKLIHAQATLCSFSYGVYSELTTMPIKATSMASGVIDGKIYLAGGFDFDQNGDYFLPDHFSVYDPENNTWDTTRAHIPVPRVLSGSRSIAMDGKLYLIGGADWEPTGEVWQIIPYARVDVYDPQSDTWELKTNLPVPLGVAGVCSMDGKFYVTGGISNENTALNSFYSYDPETDTWNELTEMPGPRSYHGSVAMEGKIYVIGGDDIGDGTRALESCEVYDPESDQWAPIARLPKGIFEPATCIVDGEIYAFGGSRRGHLLTEAYKYNPKADRWLAIDEIDPHRQGVSVIPIGRIFYLFGGWYAHEKVTNLVQTFELSDIRLDAMIPDDTIDGDVIEVDLSEYYSHVEGGEITYSVCLDDSGFLEASVEGSILTVIGMATGDAQVSVLGESGEEQMGDAFQVNVVTPTVGIREVYSPPASLHIYPNPAKGMTTMAYTVQTPGVTRIEIYDMLGKCVAVPLNEFRTTGDYEFQMNTGTFNPGIYFCRLHTATGSATVKLMVEH